MSSEIAGHRREWGLPCAASINGAKKVLDTVAQIAAGGSEEGMGKKFLDQKHVKLYFTVTAGATIHEDRFIKAHTKYYFQKS